MPSSAIIAAATALAVGAASARSPIRGTATQQAGGHVLSKREGFVELAASHGSRAQAKTWTSCHNFLPSLRGKFGSKTEADFFSFASGAYNDLTEAGCDTNEIEVLHSCMRLAFELEGDTATCQTALDQEQEAEQDFSGQACSPGAKSSTFKADDPATWDAQPLKVCSALLNHFNTNDGKRLLRDLAGCNLNGNSKTGGKIFPRADTAMHQHASGGSHGIGFAYIRTPSTSKVTPTVVDYATGRKNNQYKWQISATDYNPEKPFKCSAYEPVVPE